MISGAGKARQSYLPFLISAFGNTSLRGAPTSDSDPSADMSGDAARRADCGKCGKAAEPVGSPAIIKKSFRREPIPSFTFVTLGWVGVSPSIAPLILDAQARRSHLMPVYGVIGQKVARVEQVVTVSSSCQGEYHHEKAFSSNGCGARSPEPRWLCAVHWLLRQGQSPAAAGCHQRLGTEWRGRPPCWSLYLSRSAAAWPLLTVFRVGKLRQHSFDLARFVPAGLMLDAELER